MKAEKVTKTSALSGTPERSGRRCKPSIAKAAIAAPPPGEPPDYIEDYDRDYDGGEHYCYACGGRGWRVTCIDDLCYGEDECIHGDPPTPCRECNPKGDKFDDF